MSNLKLWIKEIFLTFNWKKDFINLIILGIILIVIAIVNFITDDYGPLDFLPTAVLNILHFIPHYLHKHAPILLPIYINYLVIKFIVYLIYKVFNSNSKSKKEIKKTPTKKVVKKTIAKKKK